MFVPVNEPVISDDAKKNVSEAMETGWISSSGAFVKQFEIEFAQIIGVRHALTTTNGTTALHLALATLGIKEGDEVIVPAFTMASSWMAVMHTGAKPVFVDCELETLNIDTDKIEEKITSKTRAIMPVHIYGHPCDMDKIKEIADRYDLFVVEDAAEAHGAEYNGKKAGAFGEFGCFSFYANKIITCGEGGMVVTDDDELANKALKIKDLHHSDVRFIHDGLGYNYRMTNLQAGVGLGELRNLEKYLQKKEWMTNLYNELLADVEGLTLPKTKQGVKNVNWMYYILIDPEKFGLSKDEVRIKLKESGVDSRDFFYSPSRQPILKEIVGDEKFPNTDYAAENGLYLPSGLALTEEQIKFVADKIKEIKP